MLILTRDSNKEFKSIYIGDDIKITLIGIKGNQVRLGFIAPNNVRIVREELLQEHEKFDFNIEEEGEQAA
jgi:carbon storage regulator